MDLESLPKVILVTGGAGFIGSHVADALLRRGDKVVVVDEMNDYYDTRLKEANLAYLYEQHGTSCIVYKGDVCDFTFIRSVFEKEKPTHICHLAARAGVRASIMDPYIYVHSNIEGTTRLLDLARQHACQNFVYASSSSVYGCSEKEILSEEDVVEKPVSPYAATKKACELLAYTFHHIYGLNCTGLRFFTVYGPRGRPDMAPFKFIDRVYNGHAIQQYGDGTTSRDYTYIDDIVEGVVSAIDRPLGYQVINLGNGRPFLLRDFIKLVEDSVGKKAIIEIWPEQPGDVDRTCANISKASSLLDYKPKVTFEEGIARTAQWYMAAHRQGLFFNPEEQELLMSRQPSVDRNLSIERLSASSAPAGSLGGAASPPMMKSTSDLELSSFVQKAPRQIKIRDVRIFQPITAQPLVTTVGSSSSCGSASGK